MDLIGNKNMLLKNNFFQTAQSVLNDLAFIISKNYKIFINYFFSFLFNFNNYYFVPLILIRIGKFRNDKIGHLL